MGRANRISKSFLLHVNEEDIYGDVMANVLELMASPHGVVGYIDHDGNLICPSLTRHIWESIVATSQICLHVRVLSGRNAHHVVEAQFKAVARALRDAVALDPRVTGIPSTKGTL